MIKVWEDDSIDFGAYQGLVDSIDELLVYHTMGYLKLISRTTGSKLGIVVYLNNGKLEAAMPFCIISGPLGKVMNSLPFFGSYGGIISIHNIDPNVENQLVAEFLEYAKVSNCISATVICSPFSKSNTLYKSFSEFNYVDTRIGLVTLLEPGITPEKLITLFEEPRPRNIRKAAKEGIRIVEDNSKESLDFLEDFHVLGMREIGGIPKPDRFFQGLKALNQEGNWKIFRAIYQDQTIASLLLLYSGKTVEYFIPVSKAEYRSLQPLSLAIFTAMNDAVTNGYTFWNWGGTWKTQLGVYNFKKKWAVNEYEYSYFTAVFQSEVLNFTKEYLLEHYKYFYVIPFNVLKND